MKVSLILTAAGGASARIGVLLRAAKALPDAEVQAVLLGDPGSQREELIRADCDELLFADTSSPYCAESALPLLQALLKEEKPSLVLFGPDISGGELAPRLAARLNWPCQSGVSALALEGGELRIVRGAYNRNLQGVFSLPLPAVLTLARGSFEPLPLLHGPRAALRSVACMQGEESWHGEIHIQPAEAVNDLTTAPLIVAGGRGVGSRANMEELAALAGELHGMLGLTRPAAVDGWGEHSAHIGISGVLVKPELCLVLGASGASAFLGGVTGSKTLIAVNTDPSAAIFRACDIGIVGDCMEFARALRDVLARERKN